MFYLFKLEHLRVCEISRCIAWSRWGNANTFMGLDMVQHPEHDCQNVYLCPRINKEFSFILSAHYFMLRKGSLRTIYHTSEEAETPLCGQKSIHFMPIIGKLFWPYCVVFHLRIDLFLPKQSVYSQKQDNFKGCIVTKQHPCESLLKGLDFWLLASELHIIIFFNYALPYSRPQRTYITTYK